MTTDRFLQHPHRRFNPLTREWTLVSPQRLDRPWQGRVESSPQPATLLYDPDCYLCPGNARADGKRNPNYRSTFVFENDFPALIPDAGDPKGQDHGLLIAEEEKGICRVVCFSEHHDLSLSRMNQEAIRNVVNVWIQQAEDLGKISWINYVQIFENRGAMMGASNPHPHCQIWASASLPNQVEKESASQYGYKTEHDSCLLCDYLTTEMREGQRLVCKNEDFAVVVPFWATWPYEVLLVSRRHMGGIGSLTENERNSLAEILRRLSIRYDNLFEVPFPYTMGFHQQPSDGKLHPEWHFHAHYYPPLLRSATVSKFMVGYEMLGSPQRDLTPELAAERLRACCEIHYLERL